MSKKKGKEVEVKASGNKRTWNETVYNRTHTLTPRIKKFIYSYVSNMGTHTLQEFADKFGVHQSTITTWLAWPIVKDEINRLMSDTESRVMSLIENNLEVVVKGVLKIFNNPKTNPEIKRKIAYNILSFRRIKDINTGRQVIVQQQSAAVGQVNVDNMSDEELRAELKTLESLREA